MSKYDYFMEYTRLIEAPKTIKWEGEICDVYYDFLTITEISKTRSYWRIRCKNHNSEYKLYWMERWYLTKEQDLQIDKLKQGGGYNIGWIRGILFTSHVNIIVYILEIDFIYYLIKKSTYN